jgi:hypothetical protein
VGVGPPLIAPAPALTPVLTFRPRAMVWLCCTAELPAFTLLLTFSPRATVWLWFGGKVPAFTCVLTFIFVFSFLEILSLIAAMAVAPLVKWLNRAGYYRRIFFSAWSSDWRGAGEIAGRRTASHKHKSLVIARLFRYGER